MNAARASTRKRRAWLAAAMLMLAAERSRAAEPDSPPTFRDNVYENISTEVPTPHVRWAPKLPGGTLRVLVVAPAWAHRESVELMQRFDIHCTPLMTLTHTKLAGITYGPVQYMTPNRVAERFDSTLENTFDVILIGGINWRMLHLEHRYEILRKVFEDGTGIVYVAPPDDHELNDLFRRNPAADAGTVLHGIPRRVLPELADKQPGDILRNGRFGNGRWVTLNYRTMSTNQAVTPAPAALPQKPWTYEYYQSLIAKALLFAGGRNLTAEFHYRGPERVHVDTLPLLTQIDMHSDRPHDTLTVETWLHDLQHNRHLKTNVTTDRSRPQENTTSLHIRIPHAPPGNYLICLRVADRGVTLGWGAWPITLDAAPAIQQVVLEKKLLDTGSALRGQIALTADLPHENTVHITLEDRLGRVLAQEQQAPAEKLEFNLSTAAAVTRGTHTVVAELIDSRQRVKDRREVRVTLAEPEPPDFHLAIWEESQTDFISRLWYSRFRQLGVDAIFYTLGRRDPDAAAQLIADAGLLGAPMAAAYSPDIEKTNGLPCHKPCLHDPEFIDRLTQRNRQIAQTWSQCSVLHYGDGSDKHMHGVCFCTRTLAAFRTELQKKYGHLDALNKAWDMAFTQWENVTPKTLEQAKTTKHFRAWLEHVQFMESEYAENYKRTKNTLRTVDPRALNGPDGYGRLNSRDGSDWEKILPNLGFYNLYTYQDPPQLEITRSLAAQLPNVKLRSIYYGSYSGQFGNDAFMRRIAWFALLHDYNGLFWWNANGKTTYPASCGRLAGPDFRATRSYMISKNEIDAVRDGPAQMLAHAEREHSGIAILYDQLIVHAHTALSHPSHLVKALADIQAALEDLALQYDYVTPRDIAEGVLKERKYRVLILPRALALSNETLEHLSGFCAEGNIIIADLLPGTHDQHLEPAHDRKHFTDAFHDVQTADTQPACRSILFGDRLTDYRRNRYQENAATTRTDLWNVLQRADIHAPVIVQTDSRTRNIDTPPGSPGIEIVTYRDGHTRYLGLINHGNETAGTLVFPKPRWLADIRRGQPLGISPHIPFTLAAGECMLFAELETPPEPVKTEILAAGQTQPALNIRIPDNPDTPHRAARIAVRDPDGRPRHEYGGIVVLQSAETRRWILPAAINDPHGIWNVAVTDILTGSTVDVNLAVTAPPLQKPGKAESPAQR